MTNALTVTTVEDEPLFIMEDSIESIQPGAIDTTAVIVVETKTGKKYTCKKAFSVLKSGNNSPKTLLEQLCTRAWKMAFDIMYSIHPELKGKDKPQEYEVEA